MPSDASPVIVGPASMPSIAMLVVVVHTGRYERVAVSMVQHDIIRHYLQQTVFHSLSLRQRCRIHPTYQCECRVRTLMDDVCRLLQQRMPCLTAPCYHSDDYQYPSDFLHALFVLHAKVSIIFETKPTDWYF